MTTTTAERIEAPKAAGRPKRDTPSLSETERRIRARESAVAREVQLSWRLQEFAAATGISLPTLWRRVKAGDVRVVKIGGVTLVPRSEAQRLGLIDT